MILTQATRFGNKFRMLYTRFWSGLSLAPLLIHGKKLYTKCSCGIASRSHICKKFGILMWHNSNRSWQDCILSFFHFQSSQYEVLFQYHKQQTHLYHGELFSRKRVDPQDDSSSWKTKSFRSNIQTSLRALRYLLLPMRVDRPRSTSPTTSMSRPRSTGTV